MNDKVKKLIYQSHYRSAKEADLLLSEFAKTQLPTLNNEQINLYEKLLSYPDSVIQSFVIDSNKTPKELLLITQMIREFIEHKNCA
jgi:succinate dehydrogenase flavin-adding protein (antitoxin of CptAB toxin-antitoxin module)